MSESRRDFLKASAVAGGALAANLSLLSGVHAGSSDVIRVGLVGCGGRGSGAIEQCIRGGRNVKVTALADAFRDRAEGLRNALRNLANTNADLRNSVDIPDERVLVGLDAYERMLPHVDVVCLATPPGFRPIHIRAAVAARKHIFTEKPVCVDGPGARMCLAAFEEANRHRLSIVAG